MSWHAALQLDYTLENGRSVARYRHDGPLRILQSLYPEGDAVCHNVLVHPPGGLVGGDTLDIQLSVAAGSHGLVTTPGATRFYRSTGDAASQQVHARVEDGARLEWLPLEALAYPQCQANNKAVFDLAPGAELIGWDVTALGLPAADQAYTQGRFSQHLEIQNLGGLNAEVRAPVWLEQGRIDATDTRLMDGPLGLAGHRCLGTLFFASGTAIPRDRREAALDAVRAALESGALSSAATRDAPALVAGATSPHPQVLAVRVLSPLVEPALDLLKRLRGVWRRELWQLEATPPRTWAL
ncbi:urease accessory protein ureD [Hylemonella gracilis str. Niagara R]|uniref:Urease accessory protein UreD n=1 Tax=Hylemonella gracilis str. Niagara R TaxID=1458275 RepID=A0A016XKM2_9BURK|nr:urease accessory protein UreD [Hylemonella gracilis]EYC52450.1 urease accessory protein ureD [Hylemonella gracilis str. Niagara R]